MKKVFVFSFQKVMKWEYEIEQLPRGEHVLEGVEVEVTDFFGWVRKTRFIPIKNTVLVYPKTMDIRYIPMDEQFDRGRAASPFNIVKDTTMATGVRDYQSGDRMSLIHWKSFARTQTLMTKEFEDGRSQDLFIVLDGRPSETFEAQVEFAASILKEASSQSGRVGLLSTGPKGEVFPSIKSGYFSRRVLIHLAKIKPAADALTGRMTNYGNALREAGGIVLITGSPDWMFLEKIVRRTKNGRTITCFIVVKKDDRVKKSSLKISKWRKGKELRFIH